MKDSLYLLRYRIKNRDHILLKKIKISFLIITLLIVSGVIYFFSPINYLRNDLLAKSDSYVENNKGFYSLFRKKENNNKNNNKVSTSSDKCIFPVTGTITSDYGMRTDPISGKYSMHTGIDISGKHHDNVVATADGVVTITSSRNDGYGNSVEIKHTINGETFYSFYAHLSQIKVSVGQTVSQGDVIGIEGGAHSDPNPGYSTGHHLHFEIRTESGYGHAINPRNKLFN